MRRMAMWLLAGTLSMCGSAAVRPARADEQADLQQLKQQVEQMQQRIQKLEQSLAKKKEEEAKKPEAVQAGFGKIKFDGLAQVWGTSDSRANDTFRIRRTEIKFSGQVHPKLKWAVMFDPAKTLSQNAAGAIVQSSRPLQDALLTVPLGTRSQLDVGQYKLPTSEEGMRSSAQLDTVERALLSVRGKLGDVRDIGLMLRGGFDQGEYQAGMFNGEGQNTTDANDRKDGAARVVFKPEGTPGLELGVSTYQGKRGAAKVTNRRVGAELRWLRGPCTLKAEFMTGRDNVSTAALSDRRGWYVLGGYALDPKRQLVARYDVWDPDTDATGDREKDMLLGMNWFIEKHNAKFQVNLVRKNFDAGTAGSQAGYPAGTRHVNQFLSNLQVAF